MVACALLVFVARKAGRELGGALLLVIAILPVAALRVADALDAEAGAGLADGAGRAGAIAALCAEAHLENASWRYRAVIACALVVGATRDG